MQIKCGLKLHTYRQPCLQPKTSLRSSRTYSSLPFTTEALKLISRCCVQCQARRKSHNWHVGDATFQSEQMKNLTVVGESSFVAQHWRIDQASCSAFYLWSKKMTITTFSDQNTDVEACLFKRNQWAQSLHFQWDFLSGSNFQNHEQSPFEKLSPLCQAPRKKNNFSKCRSEWSNIRISQDS